MTKVVVTHTYETLDPDMRPQDETMDGRDLQFQTLEHGGKYPDMMPQVIRVVDLQGRWCNYFPETVHGVLVRGYGWKSSQL